MPHLVVASSRPRRVKNAPVTLNEIAGKTSSQKGFSLGRPEHITDAEYGLLPIKETSLSNA
jgi:hypothetical protein